MCDVVKCFILTNLLFAVFEENNASEKLDSRLIGQWVFVDKIRTGFRGTESVIITPDNEIYFGMHGSGSINLRNKPASYEMTFPTSKCTYTLTVLSNSTIVAHLTSGSDVCSDDGEFRRVDSETDRRLRDISSRSTNARTNDEKIKVRAHTPGSMGSQNIESDQSSGGMR